MEFAYKIYHFSHYEHYSTNFIENTNKIVIPLSYFFNINHLYEEKPYINFVIENENQKVYASINTFCDSQSLYVPAWMLRALNVQNGETVYIKTALDIPKGNRCKVQAQSCDFLKINDPRLVLESAFIHYTVVCKNQLIKCFENSNEHVVKITEVFNDYEAIDIVDTNLEMDFDKPVGYESPKIEPKITFKNNKPQKEEPKKFVPFSGKGYSLK